MSDLIDTVSVESLRALLQSAGYRAEIITDPTAGFRYLRSATNGVGFDLRMGNRIAADSDAHTDIALVAVFNIVGELPLAPVNAWNNGRRFGRLQVDTTVPGQNFLVLCMDVLFAGGVTEPYVRTQIEIWDGLLQQLVVWLRDALARVDHANGVASEVPSAGSEAIALAEKRDAVTA